MNDETRFTFDFATRNAGGATEASAPTTRASGTVRSRHTSRLGRALLAVGAVGMIVAGTIGTVNAASPAPSPRPAGPALPLGEGHRLCAAEWLAAGASKTIETLRLVGDCEINRRIATLDALDSRVAGAPSFTDLHKDQLRNVNAVNPASYAAEKSGLLALKARIDGETDLKALRGEIAQIVEDFRVYVLVVPKTHLVGGADAIAKAVARLGELAVKLQDLINKAAAGGKDVTQAQSLLNDLKSKTSQAGTLAAPVVGSIMPLSPAGWNAGTAGPVLATARTSVHQARDLVQAARAEAKQIIDLLKA